MTSRFDRDNREAADAADRRETRDRDRDRHRTDLIGNDETTARAPEPPPGKPLVVGDRVKFEAKFLRGMKLPAESHFWRVKGTVVGTREGEYGTLVEVRWDDDAETSTHLARKLSLAREATQ